MTRKIIDIKTGGSRVKSVHPKSKPKVSQPVVSEEILEIEQTAELSFVPGKDETFDKEKEDFLKEMVASAKTSFSVPPERHSGWGRRLLKVALFAGIALVLAGGVYALGSALAGVDVTVKLSESIQEGTYPLVLKKSGEAEGGDLVILEERFKEFKYSNNYPATGQGEATGYAKGNLTIYNEYSQSAMTFVKGTRFQTEDGKIYRTQSQITIPAYTLSSGAIKPGTVTVAVTSDKAGGDYNLSKDIKLKVTAYAGTSRFEKVYGVVQADFQGGVQGMASVITDNDMKAAKQNIAEFAFNKAKEEVLASLPEGAKVFDRALQLEVSSVTSPFEVGDAASEFAVEISGELRLWVFDESQVINYVNSKLPDPEIKNDLVQSDLQLFYENLNADFAKGEMSFNLRAKRVLRPALDTLAFKQKIAGQEVAALRTEVLKFEGVERVEVSVWPFWVSRLPDNLDKIRLTIE